MKKSLLTVLVILVLVGGLFVLTGCGEKKEENNTNNTNTQNNTGSLELVEFHVQNLVPNTTIKQIYAAVSGTENWSPDLMNGLELANGTQTKIGLGLNEETTIYDFKVVDEEGSAALFTGVDLSSVYANKSGVVTLQLNEDNEPIAVVK